jgi:alginate O-acetyltransferase complex protein AlgJ
MTDATHTSELERVRHPVVEALYCLFAAALLVVPGVMTFLPDGESEATLARERRASAAAPRPRIDDLAAFHAQYQAWFGRSFGLRGRLLRLHAHTWYHAFGRAPGRRIMLGKDDWLFTTASNVIGDVRGVAPLSERELDNWRRTLEARRDWLESRGIHFVFAIVPSKSAVYPELLPERFDIVGKSRRQSFLDYMREHSDVEVLDLLPAVLEAKAQSSPNDNAYFPLGTHWTPRGAYHGYRAIIDALGRDLPELQPWPLADFESIPITVHDDESDAVFLDDLLTQSELRLEPKRGWLSTSRGEDDSKGMGLLYEQADQSLPRALFIRDSFGVALAPFLAQHFSRLQSLGTDSFPVWAVEELQPDVVIQVYVDRFAESIRPTVQTLFDQAAIKERFEASNEVRLAAVAPGRHTQLTGYQQTRISGGGIEPTVLHLDSLTRGFLVDEARLDVEHEIAVLRVAFEAPAASYASVYYMEAEAQGYRHQRREKLPARAGFNELYFLLSSPTMTGPLLVRPGSALGDYPIIDCELRVIRR